MDSEQAIESSGGFKYMVFRDGRKSFKDEYDEKCRESSKTRRSVDAYPDFQSVIRTHRLLDGGCLVNKMKFEDLEVWKRSSRLSVELYKCLADCRDYGFKDQITRSGLSIPSNIAEGMDRSSHKEKIRFLDIAKGSCAEPKSG